MRQTLRNHPDLASALLLSVGLIWIWASADRGRISTQGEIPVPKQGFSAPDFNLETLSGATIQLYELRGNPVVINFWASWCQPCLVEMPAIERAYQQYRAQGLAVLAINATAQDNLASVSEFVIDKGLSFPVLLDQQGEIMSLYQVSALPTTFFVDAEGVIQEVVIGGPMAEALLTSRMERLLEGK